MDPLSALAIATAVVQFVEIGGKVVIKCWEKYQKLQNPNTDEEREDERERIKSELQERLAELTTFVSEAQLPSTDSVDSQPATPAQQQLISAASNCSKIRTRIDQIADRFVILPNSELDSKGRRRRALFSRSRSEEPSTPSSVTSEEIDEIKNQCQKVRSQAMDSILLCLWENSKQTKQWEIQFATQLDSAIGLLKKIDNQIKPSPLTSQTKPPNGDHSDLVAATLDSLSNDVGLSFDRTKFRDAVLPLVEAGQSISLVNLAADITMSLGTGEGIPKGIRNELVEVLWREDWELDMSIPSVSALPNLDPAMVAHAVTTSIRFKMIDERETAIPKAFESTYSWILHPEPPRGNGKPLWESFPRWLEDRSSAVYWITGKPGSGKSTMMKFLQQQPSLLDYLSKDLGTLRLLMVRYYAWNAGKDLQKSFEGLKKTLISQALKRDPDLTSTLAPRRWVLCQVLRSIFSLPSWDAWEIEEAYRALLSQCGKTIKLALFIDGLDEFDAPPRDVVQLIREMSALCPTGLKICVASRPWNTFSDEFGQGPALEMHLATHNDMIDFVSGSFETNRAFVEHQALNPQATSQLVNDIVARANGVFQWVSLVVPLLLDLLTDGESPAQSPEIQQVLQDLPSELETLYDTIWARIKRENLHNASFMMQIMGAAGGPVSWLTMWVVENLKSASGRAEPSSNLAGMSPRSIESFRKDDNLTKSAKLSLKRKLAGRTKGILELNLEGDGFVDYIHRTARDWASNPETWKLICEASKNTFDPYLYLFEAETLTLSYRRCGWSDHEAQLRDAVWSAFWLASKVVFIPENNQKLIKCLELLQETCRDLGGDNPNNKKSCWAPARFNADNTFLGLAAQFSILPYIESALMSDRGHQYKKTSNDSLGPLENAVFGPLYYDTSELAREPIPHDQRLATVKYLLEHGVYQSRVQTWSGVRNLKNELERTPPTHPEYKYHRAVLECLDEMSKVTQVKLTITSVSERLKSRVGFLRGRD